MSTTQDWFNPTQEEINKATGGGYATFKDGEVVSFLVNDINETVSGDGSPVLVINCQVLSGDSEGMFHKHWIRNNATSRGILINMLKAFYDDETMTSKTLGPGSLIGKKLKSTCKVSKSNQGKEFYNFYQFEAIDAAPNLSVVNNEASDIPF
jgi:hypothetical protein